jgi:hypothetical protein
MYGKRTNEFKRIRNRGARRKTGHHFEEAALTLSLEQIAVLLLPQVAK